MIGNREIAHLLIKATGITREARRVRRRIARLFELWFATRLLSEVRRIFERHTVIWAQHRSVRQTVEHDADCSPDNPMFAMIEHPDIGTYLMPGSPLNFDAVPRTPVHRAPLLGEHTDEILLDPLDMTDPELARLHAPNIIAGPQDA